MPSSGTQPRAGQEKAAGLPQLNVSLAESEYRDQRQDHRRQQSLQSLYVGPSPLPSPLSPAFSRDDPPPRLMASSAAAAPPPDPPPPYVASVPSSPAYSQASFATFDPVQKQKLLGTGSNSRSYLSPYSGGGGGSSTYSTSTEWIPMQQPLPPLDGVATEQLRRRRRLRRVMFCIAPLLLFLVVGVIFIVLGIVRPGSRSSS